MSKVPDHLQILGLDTYQSEEQLKAAYRREVKKWHPDLHHGDLMKLPFAHERTSRINIAYDELTALIERGRLVPSFSPPKTQVVPAVSHAAPCARRKNKRRPRIEGFPDRDVIEEPVKSSTIVSIGYKDATGDLYIKFKKGVIYRFFGVPETVFYGFYNATSPAAYTRKAIMGKYESETYEVRCRNP